MDLSIAVLLLISGFAILLLGGEALVAAAVSLASRFNVSPAIIGLTIIAAGTSAPELLTSLMAALNDTPDIAIGNIVGSNIFNILAILGIASLLTTLEVEKKTRRLDLIALIGFSVLFVLMIANNEVSRWEGSFFLVALNLFLIYSVHVSRKSHYAKNEELKALKNWKWDLGYLIVGALALVGGAQLALEGGIAIGQFFGLSERVIGITIISVGTGLPELATSAVAAYRRRNDIAVANVIGSNLMNTLGVTGIAATATPIKVDPMLATTDSYIMLIVTVLLFPIIYIGKDRIGKTSGMFMLMGYFGYISYLLFRI